MAKKNKGSGSSSSSKPKRIDYSTAESYDYHNPVMYEQSLDSLVIDTKGVYVDGTLGGGGHTAGILKRMDRGGNLYSFDKDPDAIRHCVSRFSAELKLAEPRLHLENRSFSEACSVIRDAGHDRINGFLLDLGVSSRQLDSANRGISYRYDGPLDMRFGTQGKTAAELIDEMGHTQLEKILREYGEEPFSRLLAQRIVEARRAGSLSSTADLKILIEKNIHEKYRFRTLSRVFQALRIAVNDELGLLHNTLTTLVPFLLHGGRAVIITYHSLEERIVRNSFKSMSRKSRPAGPGEDTTHSLTVKLDPILRPITKKPITPSEEEVLRNPRSRSAALWIGERI